MTDAAKYALDRVECNQYSPTRVRGQDLFKLLESRSDYIQGRPRLRKAIAEAYSKSFGRTINPETEVTVTTGANEGMLSAFMGFIEPGDEVIVFEPFFDQLVARSLGRVSGSDSDRYISNIEMPGGVVRYVPLQPPAHGAVRTSSAADWTIDFEQLEKAISPKTRMMVRQVLACLCSSS